MAIKSVFLKCSRQVIYVSKAIMFWRLVWIINFLNYGEKDSIKFTVVHNAVAYCCRTEKRFRNIAEQCIDLAGHYFTRILVYRTKMEFLFPFHPGMVL